MFEILNYSLKEGILISKDVKRGLFYPIRIFFHSLISKTLCFSALETTQKWQRTNMLAKTMSESPSPSYAFSEFITYQIAMENDETKYKSRGH